MIWVLPSHPVTRSSTDERHAGSVDISCSLFQNSVPVDASRFWGSLSTVGVGAGQQTPSEHLLQS